MALNTESFPEARTSVAISEPFLRLDDCQDLYESFTQAEFNNKALLAFASTSLDFRQGRSRENTPWREGEALSARQKVATISLANRWGMFRTTYPQKPFDSLVVLGAHRDSLKQRMKHAVNILAGQDRKDQSLVILSCYRPLLAQEGLNGGTEYDLALNLAEEDFNGNFIAGSYSCWKDLAHDTNQAIGEYAVAAFGELAGRSAITISGSVPGESVRATTASTLMSLKTLLEPDKSKMLFVTTSLHLPYQRAQIQKILPNADFEMAGIGYTGLHDINLKSEDYKYRIILQEVGATIKNILASADDMGIRTSASI
jgi:hypothetical protein